MEIININNANAYEVKGDNISFKTLYIKNNIWLNTKEIANLFWIYEFQAAEAIKDIFFNSDIDITSAIKRRYNNEVKWYDNYYSLEVVISLWYRLKSYNKTKLLVASAKYLKEYNLKREYRVNKLNTQIKAVSNLIKYVDNQISLAI